jgi:hypothetical protein
MERRPAPTRLRLLWIAFFILLGGGLVYFLTAYYGAVKENRDLCTRLGGVPVAGGFFF